MLNDRFSFPDSMIYVMNSIYLLFHNVMPYLLFLYILTVTGRIKVYGKVSLALFSIPLAVDIVSLFFNLHYRVVFFLKDGIFYSGKFYFFYLVGSMLIYVIACMYLIIKYNNSISESQYGIIVLFILGGFASAVFEYFYLGMNMEMFFRSILSLGLLFAIENESDLLNDNSNLYNRDTFMRHTVQMLNSKKPYTVVLIKLGNIRSVISVLGQDVVNGLLKDVADYLELLVFDRRSIYDCSHYNFYS
ncbi:MAG: hypothetical protein K6G00_12355 [Treponema sp.]|nr:hypothetical protein [Treponema sp.]